MIAVDQFALEAERFERWAYSNESDPKLATREALIRITSIYLIALQLPSPYADDLECGADVERLPIAANANVRAYHGIPFDMYGEVFNPLAVPRGEPVIGSIADDILDMYRDIVTGLRAYQNGNKAGALWEWAFGFRHHWGDHATSAIRALNAWLTSNEIDVP